MKMSARPTTPLSSNRMPGVSRPRRLLASRQSMFHVLVVVMFAGIAVAARDDVSRADSGHATFRSVLGGSAPITLSARARGMTAVESERFLRRGGAPGEFRQRYGPDVWRNRAADVVRRSRCLFERYDIAVGDAALERELRRIVAQTQDPSALEDLFTALDHDPVVIKECLVRPELVDRLLRLHVGWDPEIQSLPRAEASHLAKARDAVALDSLAGSRAHRTIYRLVEDGLPLADGEDCTTGVGRDRFDEVERTLTRGGGAVVRSEDEHAILVRSLAERRADSLEVVSVTLPKVSFDSWWKEVAERYDAELPPELAAHRSSTALATHIDAEAGVASEGGTAHDSWYVPRRALEGRTGHTAVWTGSEMIIWGGSQTATYGGRYDPVTDTWSFTTTAGAPSARDLHSAVWTGREMIVWGGRAPWVQRDNGSWARGPNPRLGARYDPVLDRWSSMTTVGSPPGLNGASVVWTGAEMIVWGGNDGQDDLGLGWRYDPESDRWHVIEYLQGAPSARTNHSAVWTGTEMIIWGGRHGSTVYSDGGIYNPASDSWRPFYSHDQAPGRTDHSAVWTGSEMLVIGGRYDASARSYPDRRDGLRYDPVAHHWKQIPEGPSGASPVWTGTELVTWGGARGARWQTAYGGSYNPKKNSWTEFHAAGAPTARTDATAVWTGRLLIVWGGTGDVNVILETGGIYDFATNLWTPTSAGGEPENRRSHTAVWTGNEMLIWGGHNARYFADGASYDPTTDTWEDIDGYLECSPRTHHTAVWSGIEMVVWGGSDGYGTVNTGCRYDPVSRVWRTTSMSGAPSPRWYHGATWTGREMVVWGGLATTQYSLTSELANGARYDPAADEWRDMSELGAPGARWSPVFQWTGSEVLVWGGLASFDYRFDGALYRPDTNSWRRVTGYRAPRPVASYSPVWTGRELMLFGGDMWADGGREGARYDPVLDRWLRVVMDEGAISRSGQSAVLAGPDVILWGGSIDASSGTCSNSGARLALVTGRWTPTTTDGAPSGRVDHTAIWTGQSMIIWGGLRGSGVAVYRPGESAARRPGVRVRVGPG